MKSYWNKFQLAFNGLELRERKLVMLTSIILLLALLVALLWLPLLQAWQKNSARLNQMQKGVTSAQQAIVQLKENAIRNVNKPYEQKAHDLTVVIATQQQKIDTITSALINPKNMPKVFSKLLNQNELRLEAINNEDAKPVNISKNEQEEPLLFKHGLSLEMKGQFYSSLSYVQHLEQQDWQLYWDELSFTTLNYPNGLLELKVHTLSTSDSVLGL